MQAPQRTFLLAIDFEIFFENIKYKNKIDKSRAQSEINYPAYLFCTISILIKVYHAKNKESVALCYLTIRKITIL